MALDAAPFPRSARVFTVLILAIREVGGRDIQYSPTHLKKVMTFLTFNKDDHFTYMYNYDGNFADAVLFQKTCSGTDNATNKHVWIMPQRSELEEE